MKSLSSAIQQLMNGQNMQPAYQQMMQKVFADPAVKDFLNQHQDVLSKDVIQRGEAKLYEYYHEKELIRKGTPTVAPGYSPQLTINAGLIDVVYVPTKKLIEQQRQQHIQSLVRSINMPKFIRRASFDNYYVDDAHQTKSRNEALDAALNFVEHYSPSQFRPGL